MFINKSAPIPLTQSTLPLTKHTSATEQFYLRVYAILISSLA